MAHKVRLKHPGTNLVKTGFYGFSWTSFFFGGIPAMMRGDVGIGLGLLAAGLVASAVSAGLLWFVVGLIWAFVYNRRYTSNLLENGYVLDDAPEVVAAARQALGIVN